MVSGDVLSVTQKSISGTERREVMSDIIPLDVSYRDQIKVYIIQLVCWSLFV